MYRRNQRAKVLFANVELGQKTPGEVDFDITFRDSQNVHLFEEKVSRVLASLHSNSQAVHMLHKKLQCEAKLYRIGQPGAGAVSTFDSIEGQLPLMRRETETQKRNVASLVRRIQGLAKLVSHSLFGPPRKVCQLTDQKKPSYTKSTDFETQRQCTASREKWRKWPTCASEKESDYST